MNLYFLFLTIQGADLTKEIPLKYWMIFIPVVLLVMYLRKKFLENLFIPKDTDPDREAPVWQGLGKKRKK